jgi:hypothetical protein
MAVVVVASSYNEIEIWRRRDDVREQLDLAANQIETMENYHVESKR